MTDKKKAKRIKKEKYQTEDQIEIISFVRILIILIILVLGVYLFTRLFVTKDLLDNNETPKAVISGQVNYDVTNIGSMLNKKENEYYVIMYSNEDLNAVYYSTLVSKYAKKENALKVYYADLDNELNKKYVDREVININTNNLDEFKVSNIALIKIKDGKIEKAYSIENEIALELAK